ncbi:MAG: glycosyltransferase [Saprospiraceae bacterium]|nr:glycosyltransferase [Saprospiraceae bacterium]
MDPAKTKPETEYNTHFPESVLICPQHWGLGHITRTIPIIRYFESKKIKIVLACSGAGMDLLRLEFPHLPLYELVDYGMSYPTSNMYWNMLLQFSKLHKAIFKEKKQIESICKKENIQLIVSDARFGASQKDISSVIVSHHLHLPLGSKLLEIMTDRWMRFFYMKFDQLWIPDFENDSNLSGDLSHLFHSDQHFFIGPVSRLRKMDLDPKFEICFLLSGPEPQRTYFEELLMAQFSALPDGNALLIRGTNLPRSLHYPSNVEVIDLCSGESLNRLLCESRLIVSRSGYTTLMDLAVIKKQALLVPTPGQPEQEYLGRELWRKKKFLCVDQKNLNLSLHLSEALQYDGFSDFSSPDPLEDQLDNLLGKIFGSKP